MRTHGQGRSKLQWKRTSDEGDGDGLAIRYANHPVALATKPRTGTPKVNEREGDHGTPGDRNLKRTLRGLDKNGNKG